MKFLVFISLIAACSSHQYPKKAEPFKQEDICSQKGIGYLESLKSTELKSTEPTDEMIVAVSEKLKMLAPGVQSCFQAEIERTDTYEPVTVCLITGVDKKGKLEFFEFSNKKQKMTSEFWDCLQSLRSSFKYQPLKEFSAIQPFNLNIVN